MGGRYRSHGHARRTSSSLSIRFLINSMGTTPVYAQKRCRTVPVAHRWGDLQWPPKESKQRLTLAAGHRSVRPGKVLCPPPVLCRMPPRALMYQPHVSRVVNLSRTSGPLTGTFLANQKTTEADRSQLYLKWEGLVIHGTPRPNWNRFHVLQEQS